MSVTINMADPVDACAYLYITKQHKTVADRRF